MATYFPALDCYWCGGTHPKQQICNGMYPMQHGSREARMHGEILRLQKLLDTRSDGPNDRQELGCAGHFICARDCNWRRHTQVGDYRVSSVGDLYYRSEPGKRQTVGASGFFETLVFKLTPDLCKDNEGCGCREVAEWSEIDGERYETAGEAQAGHERYVAKYQGLGSDATGERS